MRCLIRSRWLLAGSHTHILCLSARCLCLCWWRKSLETRSEGERGSRHTKLLQESSPTDERTSCCAPVILIGGVESTCHEICSLCARSLCLEAACCPLLPVQGRFGPAISGWTPGGRWLPT